MPQQPLHIPPESIELQTKTSKESLVQVMQFVASGESEPPRTTSTGNAKDEVDPTQQSYRTYKRRYIGLIELALLNLAIGWTGTAFVALTEQISRYFEVPIARMNLLSAYTAVAFVAPCPFVIFVINKWGVKASMNVCAAIFLAGTWIIFAGTRVRSYGGLVAGSMISAVAQPFVLCAPTRYSKTWFAPNGRTLATAIVSMAYPLGSGVGALVGPPLFERTGGIYGLTLVLSIIGTLACVPAPFVPAAPPTPPSAVQSMPTLSLPKSLKLLARTPFFYIPLIGFTILGGALDTTTDLIVNILAPYGFTTIQIAITSALVIFVGFIASLIMSAILDRFGGHLIFFRIMVLLLSPTYIAVIFIGRTRSAVAVYIVFAVLGVFTLSIVPCILELQAAWTHPVSPEISSTLCWAGAQIGEAVLTVVISYGINYKETQTENATHPITTGLIFQAVLVSAVVPLMLFTGKGIFKRPAASMAYES